MEYRPHCAHIVCTLIYSDLQHTAYLPLKYMDNSIQLGF